MKALLMLLGILVTILGMISYNQNRHMADNRKKSLIVMFIGVLVFIVAILFVKPKDKDLDKSAREQISNIEIESEDEKDILEEKLDSKKINISELTKEEKKVLKKSYDSFTEDEKIIFSKIEDKMNNLDTSIRERVQKDVDRIELEKDKWIEKNESR